MRVVYHTTPRRRFMAHSTSSHLHTHEKLLHEAQALTGIKNRSIHDVMVVFAVAADEAGALTRADFERALRLLMGRRGDGRRGFVGQRARAVRSSAHDLLGDPLGVRARAHCRRY